VGDLIVVTPVAFAGTCLCSRLGKASVIKGEESKLKHREADLRLVRNMMRGRNLGMKKRKKNRH
jgi:hypothetical protein